MRGLVRYITVPVVLAVTTIVTGTVGYFFHLLSLSAYSGVTTAQLLSESFFRTLGFLVLSMGDLSPTDSLSFTLLTISRATGFLFFFYAAVAGFGLIFTNQLRVLRVETWSLIGKLPGFDGGGHVIVCELGDNGHTLASDSLENSQNVVVINSQSTDETESLKADGAIVFTGDSSNKNLLYNKARIHRAESVFVSSQEDQTNGATVEAISTIATTNDWPQVIDITARLDKRRLRRTMHDETADIEGIHLRTYGVADATARELINNTHVDSIDQPDERIHIWIVGWTSLSKALVNQLLHLMHYPGSIERQITVITETPSEAQEDIAAMSPGIDPNWWDDTEMSEFVAELFPNIDFHSLPPSDMELLCNRTSLYETITQKDKLTIFADDFDNRSLRGLLSTWAPKLDDLARTRDLDAQIAYRSSEGSHWKPELSEVECVSYRNFGQGCSVETVRGDSRDTTARQLALVYHLLYESDSGAILPDDESIPAGVGDDINTVMEWLSSIHQNKRAQYAATVWYDLPEYQRESNRFAADHIPIKYRMASVVDNEDGQVDDKTIRLLAETEHRRWCAEKILDGWEPLPTSEQVRWQTDEGEQILRKQRYHPDIKPVESLREEMDGEWNKDVSQVKALIGYPDILGLDDQVTD